MAKHILTGTNLTGYSCSLCKKSWQHDTPEQILTTVCSGSRPDFSRSFGVSFLAFIDRGEIESKGTTADDKGKRLIEKWEKDNDG
jgi:hypothetical protein